MSNDNLKLDVISINAAEFEVRGRLSKQSFSSDQLKDSFRQLANALSVVLADVDTSVHGFRLDEVTVSVEITSNGQLVILGSGIGLESKGGVELKFVRKE